jgi:hypothetical protein
VHEHHFTDSSLFFSASPLQRKELKRRFQMQNERNEMAKKHRTNNFNKSKMCMTIYQ